MDIRVLLVIAVFTVLFYHLFLEVTIYPVGGQTTDSQYDMPFYAELIESLGTSLPREDWSKLDEKRKELEEAYSRIVAAVTAAVQLVLQNSYFSFAVLGLLFMGAYLLAYVQMGNVWDLIRELFNPTVLYATSGGWFMENDLCLSFAGNEFAVLFCSGTAAVCAMAAGKRRYHRLEV